MIRSMGLYRAIAAEMELHHGQKNAISSRVLALKFGIADDGSNSAMRDIIRAVTKRCNVPICSCHDGYFIADTPAEANAYIMSLENRANAIINRAENVRRAYNHYYCESL